MNKTKAVSLLLSVALLLSIVIPGTLALQAFATGTQGDSGMVIDKTAQKNGDGSYTITLEAYATGSKITTETKTDVPTDIVLVLDQSGSMTEKMNTYAFREYSNKNNGDYYDIRHNGARRPNLYHQLADGSYASVSVKLDRGESSFTYVECPSSWKNNVIAIMEDPDDYWKYSNSLYIRGTDGNYQKVELTRKDTSTGWVPAYTYEYKFPDGTTVTSSGGDSVPNFGDKGPLYYRTEVPGEGTYTYTYTDQDGATQTIGTSTGETTQPDFTLYERYESGSVSRLNALKTAVSDFADSVKTKAAGQDGEIGTSDDVNHRVAVVGFATGNRSTDGHPSYENTEVFIGADQYNYNSSASSYYTDALQDMNTTVGYNNVIASKNALAARGATYPNYGLEMAKGILDANPVQQGEKRNRVVILFTDGTPGWSGYDSEVAGAAVTQASALKNAGVTVYSVGIFEGADATSAGIADGASNRQANQFMQNVSSNNGTPRNPSYYLSASDADTLNSIFQQISGQIEEGGSSTTLDEQSVVKDIISPSFQLPTGATAADITLETYAYGEGDSWTKNNSAMGATAVVNGDTVDVTGFDFAQNWCGTETTNGNKTYRGNKLVISFKVEPKSGFLGGNNVPTNTSAGIYENSSATDPVFTFPVPKVDVDIKSITVTAPNKDVYLLQDVPADTLKGGKATVGGVELDLTKPADNYGLESWQNAYVDITVEVKDKDGNIIANDLNGLTEDSEYTVSVKVSPKEIGTAAEQTGEGNGQIHVYKPQLTFKDSEAWYGDTAPADLNANLTETKWLHGQDEADATKMGTAPELALTFTPDASKLDNGKINTKQDIPVDVGVKIGETDVSTHTVFQHTNCDGKTCELPQDMEFLLHINTCQLTVTKTGGAAGEPYVFTVYRDGSEYSEVTIVGNGSETIYELPVGSYTISEDEGWSWRYVGTEGAAVDLSKDNTSGSISCTNSKTENYWLNGFSDVVKNIFGAKN